MFSILQGYLEDTRFWVYENISNAGGLTSRPIPFPTKWEAMAYCMSRVYIENLETEVRVYKK